MARIRICPNCVTIIKRKDEKCSKCGMLVSDMEKAKDQEKMDKIMRDIQQDLSYIENDQMCEVKEDETPTNKSEEQTVVKPKRHKHKKKNKEVPQYTVDEDGSFNIDTRDVTFLDNSSYSSKKERGEFKPEKIEWWEIYKWADRHLARRKIMKEVNKSARVRPSFIKKGTMIALCLFFGWMGAHDYYAKNYKKGILVTISMLLTSIFVSVEALAPVATFFGGGFGFIVAYTWIGDMLNLLFDKYKYRLSKEAFIAKLNVETRYKISKKYLTTDKIKAEQERIKQNLKIKLEKKEAKRRARG